MLLKEENGKIVGFGDGYGINMTVFDEQTVDDAKCDLFHLYHLFGILKKDDFDFDDIIKDIENNIRELKNMKDDNKMLYISNDFDFEIYDFDTVILPSKYDMYYHKIWENEDFGVMTFEDFDNEHDILYIKIDNDTDAKILYNSDKNIYFEDVDENSDNPIINVIVGNIGLIWDFDSTIRFNKPLNELFIRKSGKNGLMTGDYITYSVKSNVWDYKGRKQIERNVMDFTSKDFDENEHMPYICNIKNKAYKTVYFFSGIKTEIIEARKNVEFYTSKSFDYLSNDYNNFRLEVIK